MSWDRIVELCAQVGTVLGLAGLVWSLSRQTTERRQSAKKAYVEHLKETAQVRVVVTGSATEDDRPSGTAILTNTSIFAVRDVRLDIWSIEHAVFFEDAGAQATTTRHWPYLEVDATESATFGSDENHSGTDRALAWRLEFTDHSGSRWQRDLGHPPKAIGGPAAIS